MNLYEKVNEANNNLVERVKRSVTEFFPYLLILVNILFMILNTLFTVGVQNPFSRDTIIKTLINCATSTLSYACFVTYGDRHTKKHTPSFAHNLKAWGTISERIRKGSSFEAFLEYCKKAVEIEREEKRIALVTNNTRISVQQYNEIYRTMKPADIRDAAKAGVITRKEARVLNRANGNITVRPINPLLLLCGSTAENLNDAGRAQDASAIKSIAARPFSVLFFSVVLAAVTCTFDGIEMTTVYAMISSAFMIFVSSFLGYEKGTANAAKTEDAIKSRIIFLERFEKSEKIELANNT